MSEDGLFQIHQDTRAALTASAKLANPLNRRTPCFASDTQTLWLRDAGGNIVEFPSLSVLDGELPLIQLTGAVAFDSVNSGIPCAAEIDASSSTNSPANILASGGKGFLIQGRGAAGFLTQLLTVPEFTAYRMMPSSGVWAAWRIFWDREALPISTLGRDLLNDTTASEMRATIGAAEAPALITKSTAYDFTGITASLIKHTNGDVVATLSGGVPGRPYTLVSVEALLIAIPVGVTLYGTSGIWNNSTGFSLGGMRPITIQCLSSTEWLIPNYE